MASEGHLLGTPARRPRLAIFVGATAFTCFLGWLLKGQCAFDGQWSNLELYERGCYSDAYPFWHGKGLADGLIPYLDTPIEYPVLTGLMILIEQFFTLAMNNNPGDPDFVFTVTLFNAGLAMLVTRQLWDLGLPRERLLAWSLSPLLFLYAGHNWDLLAVALTVAAFTFAQHARLDRAVSFAALGAAAKLFPAVLLPLFALRRFLSGRVMAALTLAAIAIGAWIAANLPLLIVAPDEWLNFYRFSAERTGTRGATWDLLTHYGLVPGSTGLRNVLSAAAFIAGYAAIVALGWRQYRDRLWWLAGPVILWFLLTSKVYSPQFDLWAWPFLVITARRWPPLALFALGDWCAYWTELWFFAGEEGGLPAMPMGAIALASVLRAGAALWLIHDALRLPPPDWLSAEEPPSQDDQMLL